MMDLSGAPPPLLGRMGNSSHLDSRVCILFGALALLLLILGLGVGGTGGKNPPEDRSESPTLEQGPAIGGHGKLVALNV